MKGLKRAAVMGCAGAMMLSCGFERVCTLVGCGDSLNVLVQPAMEFPYVATLTFPTGQVVTLPCSRAGVPERMPAGLTYATCGAASVLVVCGGAPDYCSTSPVTVSVVGPDGVERSGVVTPTYTYSQPNGPNCEPTCKHGIATFR